MKVTLEMEMSEFEEFMLYRKRASLFFEREKELRNDLGGKLESIAGLVLESIAEVSGAQSKSPPVWEVKDQAAAAVLVAKAVDIFS